MSRLQAVLRRHSRTDVPEMYLTYTASMWDSQPRNIRIRRLRALRDFQSDRIPVYYSLDPGVDANPFADPPEPGRPPAITIIAAPGVTVEPVFPRPFATVPRLEVYRVQNPRLVPTIGTPHSVSALTANYFVDTDPHVSVRPAASASGGDIEQGEWEDRYDRVFDSRSASREEVENYLYGVIPSITRQVEIRTRFEPMRIAEGENPFVPEVEWIMPISMLQVTHQPSAVIFRHPYSRQTLTVEVPQIDRTLTASGERDRDHAARFAFRINPAGEDLLFGIMPLVTIVKSPNVTVTLTPDEPGLLDNVHGLRDRYRDHLVFFSIFDTHFDNVPPQGAPLPTRGLRPTRRINVQRGPMLEIAQTIIDVAIGMIPYVGDAADIAEFTYAVSTDRDRWGRRVSTLEKVLMGIGVVLPFVGSAALRAAPRLARTFGRLGSGARRVENALEAANFTEQERRFLLEMHEHLRQGRRLSTQQLGEAQNLIRRIQGCSA